MTAIHKFLGRHQWPGSTIAALVFWALPATVALAAMPDVTADGWHTWRVAAVQDAPDWCCYVWRNDTALRDTCELDSGDHSYTSGRDDDTSPQEMRIYARLAAGRAVALRALSPTCSVSVSSEVVDHGKVNSSDSVAWLANSIDPRSKLSTQALGAIAVHAGGDARRVLVKAANDNASLDNRKDAVFWMGQARARETADEIKALMFKDPLPEMREHAAFSLSQSDLSDRAAALERLGASDTDAGVRGKAWFWLAQTGDDDSAAMILRALDKESVSEAREAAIFALSQLPDDHGVDALIAVIENRRFSDEDRKRALFWMAQNKSDRAFDYLAAVLDD